MDSEPIAVALKFAFLVILFLFLWSVARSGVRELRAAAGEGDIADAGELGGGAAATDAWLVATRGAGLDPGERFDLFGGLSIGRSAEADVRIEDRFASGLHARVRSRGSTYLLEDLGSTNGTYLNEEPVEGECALSDLDEIRIGDTEFRFELDVEA